MESPSRLLGAVVFLGLLQSLRLEPIAGFAARSARLRYTPLPPLRLFPFFLNGLAFFPFHDRHTNTPTPLITHTQHIHMHCISSHRDSLVGRFRGRSDSGLGCGEEDSSVGQLHDGPDRWNRHSWTPGPRGWRFASKGGKAAWQASLERWVVVVAQRRVGGALVVGLLGRGRAPGDLGVALAIRPIVPVPQQQTCKWWLKSAIPAALSGPSGVVRHQREGRGRAGREGRGFDWARRLCLDVGSRRRLASSTGPRCYQHCIPSSLIIQSRFALYVCPRGVIINVVCVMVMAS